MGYRWTDTYDIARELVQLFPDLDPMEVRFTELHRYVCELPNFTDDPKRSNERILEAIQMAWVEEAEE